LSDKEKIPFLKQKISDGLRMDDAQVQVHFKCVEFCGGSRTVQLVAAAMANPAAVRLAQIVPARAW
jgi:hypothetical protein